MLAVLVLAAAPAASPLAAPAPGPAQDPVRALRSLARRTGPGRFDLEAERELAELLEQLRANDGREPAEALLELAAADWVPAPERALARADGDLAGRAADAALEALRGRLARPGGEALVPWLVAEAAPPDPGDVSSRRRLAALELLGAAAGDEATAALLAAARTSEPLARDTALRALAGRRSAAVHQYLLGALGRGALPLEVALEHLAATGDSLGEQAHAELRRVVGGLYLSSDWRDAARAGRLVPYLEPERAAPLLIESLRLWVRRGEVGRGSRRVVGEITDELRRISARAIGPDPEAWEGWWRAVRDGRIRTAEAAALAGEAPSEATFFGLRPHTDRVLFVIDRSESMRTRFGTSAEARFARATEELVRCLEGLGPGARFGLVLFHGEPQRWRRGLLPATAANVAAARRWLEGMKPDGGTELRRALQGSLPRTRDGRIDAAECDVDTVVVLCDGATAEGPAWVRPWLARANEEAQLVIHCVQVGAEGDGTLEALAAATGGDFVRP